MWSWGGETRLEEKSNCVTAVRQGEKEFSKAKDIGGTFWKRCYEKEKWKKPGAGGESKAGQNAEIWFLQASSVVKCW